MMNKEQKNKLLRQGLLDGLDRLIEKNQGNRQMFDDEGYRDYVYEEKSFGISELTKDDLDELYELLKIFFFK